MRRVVVTGIGIVSSIGNNKNEVLDSLKAGASGINYREDFEEAGLKSKVAGSIKLDLSELIDRKLKRFMSDGIGFNYLAMQEAVEDSGLNEEQVSDFRTGLIMGNGGGSPETVVFGADSLREKGKVSPFLVTRSMASGNSGVLGTAFKIKGINYSISSACATSAHCIGNAAELIQFDKQDVVFAGGGDEVHWVLASFFDGMKALSASHNDNPHLASRPFDSDRDGFVISGGGGVIVLEEYEHALARGATIYGELTGYGATSDGFDMVQPSGDGAIRCMKQAMKNNNRIDYLNAHGTSTPVGDMKELEAVREVFGQDTPRITSTKSLTGHSLGVAGVHEAIYTILMMCHDFISPSINIENLDEKAEGLNIVTSLIEDAGLETVMSNSFGFGGTNASLVFKK
ncbi:MAG: beta-ketoacyl-[acyl-carrier-protein] synthase I [Gammaproteobacteria bacterium]|nr:beta-ketoacyl-[acyl-carrier-protein] synthase I [Gammaproteobacteria bacterium]MBQ08688.1 beta-ketoacyl-[acyl-carrier-protein] synthase I [Gammaproteobacteria bacterium]